MALERWDLTDEELAEGQPCKYCRGWGYLSVEPGSSLTYQCPDCRGEVDE